MHVGMIEGGTALNMMPTSCVFDYEIRHLPTQDPHEIVAQIDQFAQKNLVPLMQRLWDEGSIHQQPLISYPGLHTEPGSPVIHHVKQWLAQDTNVSKISFGTEAGLFTSTLAFPL